jgi:hypothetical protein
LGPSTKEEKVKYDWFVERRVVFEDELWNLQDQRAEATEITLVNQLDKDILQIRRMLQIIDSKLPD